LGLFQLFGSQELTQQDHIAIYHSTLQSNSQFQTLVDNSVSLLRVNRWIPVGNRASCDYVDKKAFFSSDLSFF